MGAMEPSTKEDERPVAPVVLSHGASIALSSAVSRLLKPERRISDARGKRPRTPAAPVVLAENEEVAQDAAAEQVARRKDREAKRARLRFESNAKVIPDAATDAAREKDLLVTATRGAVALFNAVTKAQRAAKEERAKNKVSKKGKPVTRESFMSMIRDGVAAEAATYPDSSMGRVEHERAGWLKDDYLTSKSRKLKDWDTARNDAPDDKAEDDDSSEDSSDSNDDSESDGGSDSGGDGVEAANGGGDEEEADDSSESE